MGYWLSHMRISVYLLGKNLVYFSWMMVGCLNLNEELTKER